MTFGKTNKTRQCRYCHVFKPLKTFKVYKGGGKTSYNYVCQQCRRIRYTNSRTKVTKLLNLVRRRASISPDVTADFIMEMADAQDWKCALSSRTMTQTWGKGHVQTNLSLDRIDNTRPYTRDNIRLVCVEANRLKGKLTDEELIDWCRSLVGTTDLSNCQSIKE